MATNLIDVEMNAPINKVPSAPGLQATDLMPGAGGDPMAFGAKVEQADLGRQFSSLLQKGQEGMVTTANELIREGSLSEDDLLKLNPNDPAFQGESGQLKWYQGVDAIIKGKAAAEKEQARQARGREAFSPKGTKEDRTAFALESGETPKGLMAQGKMEDDKVLIEDATSGYTKLLLDNDITEATKEQDILDFITLATDTIPGVAEVPAFKALLDSMESGLDRASRERAAALAVKGRGKKDEGINFRKYMEKTEKMSAVITGINKIDSALPGGLDDPDGVGLGVIGVGSKLLKDWINTDEGVELRQAVNMFFLARIKELSGVAVTDKEFQRVEKGYGLNTRGTVNAFVQSMKMARQESLDKLIHLENLLTPEQVQKLKDGGGITSASLIPKPRKSKKKKKKVTSTLTKKSSDDEIKEYLKTKGAKVTDANIALIREQLK